MKCAAGVGGDGERIGGGFRVRTAGLRARRIGWRSGEGLSAISSGGRKLLHHAYFTIGLSSSFGVCPSEVPLHMFYRIPGRFLCAECCMRKMRPLGRVFRYVFGTVCQDFGRIRYWETAPILCPRANNGADYNTAKGTHIKKVYGYSWFLGGKTKIRVV